MIALRRIQAVAIKEWQLNIRFPFQFFVNAFIGPVKTAILLMLLYGGLLRTTDNNIGSLTADNFKLYVVLGTICHSLFSGASSLFVARFQTEKYWQTLPATLISPATALEVNAGFVAGSGVLHIAAASFLTTVVSLYIGSSLTTLFAGFAVIFVLALYSFGLGLIGGTIMVCFEGRSFLFDYALQLLTFMSCFYYPPEVFPTHFQAVAKFLPTFQLGKMLKELYFTGITVSWITHLLWLAVGGFLTFLLPSRFYQWAVKRYGIVGY